MDQHLQLICRQNAQGNSFETWRPLHLRSIGYLTRLLKPQLDEQKFDESFTSWEFQLAKYEQDNHTLLPHAVKIATLLNETKGPLQQHLQLQAGYYRAASSSNMLQAITSGNSNHRGPAPMEIGATWYNKGKGNKGKRKGKGNYNKGYGGYGNNYSYNNYKAGKCKYNQQPVGQGNPFEGKGYSNNGKGKGHQDNKDMAKEKDTATMEKAKGTRTTRIWQRKRTQQQRKRQRTPGQQGYGKGKGHSNKGKGKGHRDNRDMAKEQDTATKAKARGTTTKASNR